MWNRFLIFLAAFGLLLSCNGGGEADEQAAIAFAQNPMIVDAEPAVHDCGLICNVSWTASSKEAWVTVLTPDGKSEDALKIRVSANTSGMDRNATLTVKAGSAGKVLQLVQTADSGSGLVSDSKVSLDTYGTATYISINTESGWTYSTPTASWLKLEQKGPTALGISADINFTGESRSSSFAVSATDGSKEAEVTVTQQFSNEKFLASTEYGRRLVYAMGNYIKSVSADKYTVLTDGVQSFEMSCKLVDELGKDTQPLNRNIYLFEVDMTKATILATLPDDDNAKVNSHQLMTLQIPAMQNKRQNLTIWGGTNGDFFGVRDEIQDTYELQGIIYRGGDCLKGTFATTVNTVFAVFKDGTAKCMNQTTYNSVMGNIKEAVGGRQALLWNKNTVGFSDPAQHPRTAVGTSADGKTVWILVVDGRDELYSTGSFSVSYEPLARILKAAGAADAINLDGGGSSTYVVRESDGNNTKHNKPGNSGRMERLVLDGLAIATSK